MSRNQQHTDSRIPPQAIEVEESILGGMMLDRDAAEEALRLLTPDDFYRPGHRIIFQHIQELFDKNENPDQLVIEQKLKDTGQIEQIGGPETLDTLSRQASIGNIAYNAQILIEKSLRRNLILESSEVSMQAYDQTEDIYDLLDRHASFLDRITINKTRQSGIRLSEGLPAVLDTIAHARENPTHITGVPTGLDVDQYTSGWQPGDFIIIAARPSMGKTALALSCSKNAADYSEPQMRSGGAIFSLEMSHNTLIRRYLSIESGINSEYMRNGRINEKELKKLCTETSKRLYNLNIWIDDASGVNLRYIRSKARSYKRQHDIGWIIIDYLQLMSSDDRRHNNREQEIAAISRGLKSLAKELDIPVIALSQLSRALETRGGDKRPMLSDLRESGQIEQDADVVIFLYRPEYYKIQTDEQGNSTAGVAEIIIAKQRDGPVGTARSQFNPQTGQFHKLAFHSEPYSNGKKPEPTIDQQRLPYKDMDDDPKF